MRHFQLLTLALLAVIALDLSLIVVRVPAPTVQAQQTTAPSALPALTAEHMELKKQLDALSGKIDALTSKADALAAKVNLHAESSSRFEDANFESLTAIWSHTRQICRAVNQPCGN